MTTDEALEATRKLDNRPDAIYEHMVTLENGRIYIKALYPNAKHIGCGGATYIWDGSTGKLIRCNGGK